MNSTSRRSFLAAATATLGWLPFQRGIGLLHAETSSKQPISAMNHVPVEWSFSSSKQYSDPYNDVLLDVEVSDPQGQKQLVPAYWAGSQTWKVRYGSHVEGLHTFRTICSDTANADLHGRTGTAEVRSYTGSNPLYRHGAVRVSDDKRHFAYSDGAPFFWLGDTWWFGLCKRFPWPDGFKSLTANRGSKGFTVIQITSGLNPEFAGGGTPPFDPRSFNEAGYPWEDKYARINPRYWDLADVRIKYLIDNGLMPCLVGAWGYHLSSMGVEKMKQHWRYMIARWGAYPVIWCLAGELTMPYYPPRTATELEDLKKQGLTIEDRRHRDSAFQKVAWTAVARYVRENDPYHRLLTLHPQAMHSCLDQLDDPSLIDFELLQTNHDDWWGTPSSLELLVGELEKKPQIPVMIGEVSYEGLQEHNRQEIVRFDFWSAILSGAAGHTYGAGGIFEMESKKEPYGLTPDGNWHSYRDEPWDVAATFPGAQQLAWGKALLQQFEWWRLEPHPEWVTPHWSGAKYLLPFAAFIPGELAIVYIPSYSSVPPTVSHLDPSISYDAFWFCPSTAKEEAIREVRVEKDGAWTPPLPEEMVEWVLVIAKRGTRKKLPNRLA
jgi:hypothetical protein